MRSTKKEHTSRIIHYNAANLKGSHAQRKQMYILLNSPRERAPHDRPAAAAAAAVQALRPLTHLIPRPHRRSISPALFPASLVPQIVVLGVAGAPLAAALQFLRSVLCVAGVFLGVYLAGTGVLFVAGYASAFA